jgi:hypothetical protein
MLSLAAPFILHRGAALRGDCGRIITEDGDNLQENGIHMFPDVTVGLKKLAAICHELLLTAR